MYGKDWGDRICNLPIGNEDQGGKIVWFDNPHGCFTSKSAYSWLLLKEMGFGLHRCGAPNETLLHALRDCPTSREVLSLGRWDMSITMKQIAGITRTTSFSKGKKTMCKLFRRGPAILAECIAFERSIELAGYLNINDDVLFETDHASLVNIMNSCSTDVTIIDTRINACGAAFHKFKLAKLIWSNWSCTKVADFICTKMCKEAKIWLFDMVYLKDIHKVVISDVT
ncbi:hypothetical protein J1N35_026473 [Gossypium stocksii]|uniref:RNase H type-1 domain-containing protein n=1 Tax=Gossypium stocksii TaxID=47602 RepID=A0A9D3ZX49_9ROSI|nr:hypothetical protein J1N35_026473 [Gossypium stocksii]